MAHISWCMRFGVGLAMVVGMMVPSASWAQAVTGKKAPAAGTVEIEEITVTAQKREESLQEIPISVTALGSEKIEEKGVTTIVDLGQAVPNLRISTNTGGSSGTTVSMRGVSQGNPNVSLQTPVGLYIDGAYISKMQGSNFDLEDLERVEVLRGPQGTLYGRNTIGGAVNFITRKPTEERSITVRADVGNYETFNGRLTLNVPLIGKNGFFQSEAIGTLSLRETVGYKTHDGYYRNALRPGEPSTPTPTGASKLDDLSRIYNTTALRWQPTKDITIDYSLQYHRYRTSGAPFQLTYVYPGSPVAGLYGPAFDLRPYIQTNRTDTTPHNATYEPYDFPKLHRLSDDGNDRMHILTGAWDLGEVGPLGNVTVRSIASYRKFVIGQNEDLDGSPLHIADISNRFDVENWSEELQWVGTAPRLHYVVGFYYYGENGQYETPFVAFLGGVNVTYKNLEKQKSYAPYGQVTWTPPILNDKLSVTAGIRYSQEQVHVDKWFHDIVIPTNDWSAGHGKAVGGIHGTGAPGISPMGDLSYQWTDDVMTYFRISRGFKGGGFAGDAGSPESFAHGFNPEKLLQYEAGFKSQWFDRRLRLNASGFYSDYTDLQVSTFRPTTAGGTISEITNAAAAEIWGMEFEGTAMPLRGLEATVSYSFLAPKYTEWLDQKFDANNQPVIDPVTKQPVFENVSDKRSFAYSPKHQISVGLTYTAPPTQSGTLSAHVDTYWQDKVSFIPNNDTAGAQANEGWAYAVVNGRLQFAGIPLQKGSLDLALWGRNLLDRKYRVHGIDFGAAFGFSGNAYGYPRTFGLQMTYNFTAGAEPLASPPAPVAQVPPPPPAPAKKKIVLRSVHFDFDKATLKAEAKPILDEAVQVLKQEGSVDIVVEGHTDSVGTDQYNLGLSRRRADTVRRYLVDHGVAASRITAEGLGESKPVASNDTADGRAQNRRVELHVK